MALFRSLARPFRSLHVAAPAISVNSLRFAAASSPAPLVSSRLPTRASIFFPLPHQLQFVRTMGYKLKTKAAVKKRFKVNCNGLVKRAQANKRHIATKKTRERIRRLGKSVFVQGQIRKNVLRMLGK
uniref:50S ribosomal protein L35 n=1 Tax=Peronospora matthiolae TaxID=2874970 RepID=A0AAV1TB35_9STRA